MSTLVVTTSDKFDETYEGECSYSVEDGHLTVFKRDESYRLKTKAVYPNGKWDSLKYVEEDV